MPGQTTTSASNSKAETPIENTASIPEAQKTEAEKEADRIYEERIEEEYAKREGGA